jgi:phytoene dehydrogenase-like protein
VNYDVIIIGGGLSGLTAGVTAAKRGKKVLLLEKHTCVGGLAGGFFRKGYYFDAGMSRCLSYIAAPLRTAGIDHELKRHRMIYNIAGQWANYSNLERYFADLGEIFSEERAGLQSLYQNEIRPVERILIRLFSDFNPEERSPKILRLPGMLGAVLEMRRTTYTTEAEKEVFARHLQKGGRAYAFLIEQEDEVDYRGAMSFFTKVAKLYSQGLNVYPSRGYLGLAEDMAAAIRAHGGEVRTGVDVKQILLEAGKATGVNVISHGFAERILAKKVVCCIDLKKAFLQLIGIEHLDTSFVERLAKSKLSRAMPILYLGVNIPPETIMGHFRGYDEVCYFPEIGGAPAEPTFFRSHSMLVHSSCFHNPGHAPAGKTNLQLYLSCPPDGWMGNWGLQNGQRTQRYRQIKAMVTADILSALERLIPQLLDRSKIEFCELGTPFTIERYTGNTEGSGLGFRMDADYVNSRKMGQYFDRYPGIGGLHFAGQQTGYPGGALIALQTGRRAGNWV